MDAGIIAAVVLAAFLGVYVLWRILLIWASGAYKKLVADNAISVDEFVLSEPSAESALKVVVLHKFNCGSHVASKEGLPLKAEESDKVPGLKVTKRAASSTEATTTKKSKAPLVVGTIRMGFGHHRIAYAATSWGLGPDPSKDERDTYFHDLLNIESEEATMIHDTDKLYSKGSRMASELGGPVEALWGSITKSGDEDSLRVTYQWAEHLLPIISGLDRNSPIVASHSLVAAAAVAAGFKNVINLVIDNHAQWFVVVPGALNLVQGPSNYHNFLKMGVKPEHLQLAGHWIPRDLVESIPDACKRRIHRAKSTSPRKPLRLLIPVGGAGAQRKFIVSLVKALLPLAKENKVQLFLNAADHAHMKESFSNSLSDAGVDYDVVSNMTGVRDFRAKLLSDWETSEPAKNVTLFAFDDYFTAVATTDILCNVADVLACKPSELAFYPIPKLMIRRVGDHEEYSALRASELGDGTLEARTVKVSLRYVDLFLETELLVTMNEAIVKNNEMGIYDGCKNAIKIALERAKELEEASSKD
uniref:Uncharacterized protein n=1 Tax=Ditylum brightwellii TaxID=49249 RepID=A0A7S1ZJM2_9STRA